MSAGLLPVATIEGLCQRLSAIVSWLRRRGTVKLTMLEGMIVLLMRHADREPSTDRRNERNLPLTALGIKEVASVSRQLAEKLAAHPPVKYVLASPHCAAMETARRVMEVLAIPGAPVAEDALDPDLGNPRDPRAIAAIVDGLVASASKILIVGHQPLLGELGRSWTGQRVSPVRTGVACIERRRSEARLLWMLEPQLSSGTRSAS